VDQSETVHSGDALATFLSSLRASAGRCRGPWASIGLARHLVLPYRPDNLLTLAALVSGFHEVVVRFGSDPFPFTEQDLNRPGTVVIGALAQERHRLRVPHVILNEIVKSLICLPETHLVLLSALSPRGHVR
jgi:hypothetical protein